MALFRLARAVGVAAPFLCTGALADLAISAPSPLSPHRAVYELTLLKSTGTNAIANAHGRIAFDFSGSVCEGYVQNFRQITEMQPTEGQTRLSDMRSATFESGDGANYRFKIETKIDEVVAEAVDGKAKKAAETKTANAKPESGKLSIDLVKPKQDHVDFAGEALFPTEHVRHILVAARAGENLLEAKVYDGSGDGRKVFDTTTIIGRPIAAAPTEKAVQTEPMKSMRRWPVAISYFEPGKKDGQPAYVLSVDLFDNGVSGAIKLDYGDFVLKGEMTELTLLQQKPCGK